MGYSLHFQRGEEFNPDEFSLDDWKAAVESTDNVRFDSSDYVGRNPKTGEEIRVKGDPHTAAVYFPDDDEWIKVFSFYDGMISFKAGFSNWDDADNASFRQTALELASKLGATIRGESEEIYQ